MGHCIIFGSGGLLGSALAHRFGAEGDRVGLISRGQAGLEHQVADLVAAGAPATYAVGDVAGSPDDADRNSIVGSVHETSTVDKMLGWPPLIGDFQ